MAILIDNKSCWPTRIVNSLICNRSRWSCTSRNRVRLPYIRWYVAYPLSYRHLEEIMKERGVSVDHSSINRWAIRFLPLIEKLSRKHKRPVGGSWRMDETYIKVKGVWNIFTVPSTSRERASIFF